MRSATSTNQRSPLPSFTSQSKSKNPSVGIIVGASIAGLTGVVSLAVAILLYVRTRSKRKREVPQNEAPNKGGSHQGYLELTGLNMAVESGGREAVDRELSGYPIAVSHRFPVGELEGRG